MLCAQDQEIAFVLKEKLSQKVPLLDLRVFGSRARGVASTEADFNVFVVIPERNKDHETAVSDISWDVGFDHRVVIVPLIVSQFELQETALRSAPLIQHILREGIHA